MKIYYIRDKNGKAQKVEFGKTRVILVSDHYGKGRNDPKWGSVHACAGTVLGHSKDSEDPMRVQWDNERINIYHPDHLQIYGDQKMEDNPNFTFKRAQKTKADPLTTMTNEATIRKDVAKKMMDEIEPNPTKTINKEYMEFLNGFKDSSLNKEVL